MRKREKGVTAHIILGPEEDDCPLCNFEGSPEELEALMEQHGGLRLDVTPREHPRDPEEEGHWEDVRLGPGMLAKKWVRKKDGC